MKLFHSLVDRIVTTSPGIALGILGFCFPAVLSAQTATIPLKDLPQNSRLAIWGDSITEVTLYPRYIEMYLLACAGRKDIKVCTFGHSGETLNGLITRQSDFAITTILSAAKMSTVWPPSSPICRSARILIT